MYTADVYDVRLGFVGPAKTTTHNLVLPVGPMIPLAATFATVRAWAGEKPLAVLRLLCHGNATECQHGKEELSAATVHLCRLLRGSFQEDAVIAIYSCQTAARLGPSVGPGSDPLNDAIMSYVKEMAAHCGVPLIASPDLQLYHKSIASIGRWEGTVYAITPARRVVRVPNLGTWGEYVIDLMRKVGLNAEVRRLIHAEVVKRHPDYNPKALNSITGMPPR